MPPLEAFQKVLVSHHFPETLHGKLGCSSCHGGNPKADTFREAHLGIEPYSLDRIRATCGDCHKEIVDFHEVSLHGSVNGYFTAFLSRSDSSKLEEYRKIHDNHCADCHTTCADCHISRPQSVGGGLVSGHIFVKRPSITESCTACHGSRIGDEYLGKNPGLPPDLHWKKGEMDCIDCHSGVELHGDGSTPLNRYEVSNSPKCQDCHQEAASGTSGKLMHDVHEGKLDCYVCHSVKYKNCYGCHVGLDEAGLAYRVTDKSGLEFKIGRNPDVAAEVKYLLLRHVPIAEDSYDFYREDILSQFSASPVWRPTTPHNVQKFTPQNFGCNSCHGKESLFLTPDDLLPQEVEANAPVVLSKEDIPLKIGD